MGRMVESGRRAVDPAVAGGMAQSSVTVLGVSDSRWDRFAMRMALGASVTEAAQRAGVSRSLGYEWMQDPRVQGMIEGYAQEAARQARRELAGMIRQATRTYRRLMKDGGASHKGAPTELLAATKILEWAHIDELPATTRPRSIMTYVPREGRTAEQGDTSAQDVFEVDETLQAIEDGQQRGADVPVRAGRDGLPEDFPRTPSDLQAPIEASYKPTVIHSPYEDSPVPQREQERRSLYRRRAPE